MGIAGAIAGAAVIGAGASIIGGNKAASASQYAADKSAEVQKYQYDTTRADLAPYRAVGNNALYKLAGLYGVGTTDPTAAPATSSYTLPSGSVYGFGTTPFPTKATAAPAAPAASSGKPDYGGFYASPSYQWRLDQGLKAIERRASANGSRFSGATMKAMDQYAGGEASQEFDTYANRLAAMAGVGQTATNSTAAAGQNYATGAANAYTNAGNARASAYANTGNAINQGVQNVASAYLYNKGFGGGGSGSAFYDSSYNYGGG